jgi:hypothetical protein
MNAMSPDKRRISYAEWKDVYEGIEAIADRLRLTPTEVFRMATSEFIERNVKILDAPNPYDVVDQISERRGRRSASKK